MVMASLFIERPDCMNGRNLFLLTKVCRMHPCKLMCGLSRFCHNMGLCSLV